MLLEFSVSNFKSFKEKAVFSMIPAPKIKDLEYSIIKEKIAGKTHKVLSSSVIYGPNASGKTNIITALYLLRKIIIKKNINEDEDNDLLMFYPLIPNKDNSSDVPICFSIKFIEKIDDKSMIFEYNLDINVGGFLDENFRKIDKKIINEELLINNEYVFSRDKNKEIDVNYKYINKLFKTKFDSKIELDKNNLSDADLFLYIVGIQYTSKISNAIYNWFFNKLDVIYHADQVRLNRKSDVNSTNKIIKPNEFYQYALRDFGFCGKEYIFKVDDDSTMLPASVVRNINGKELVIPSEAFESFGTVRFIDIFDIIIKVLESGKTLVVDEFDVSIHPMALLSIINLFHNDEINKNKAQLIFNTHNTIFLDKSVFRRDEIKFTEKTDDTSILYSLSDFKTSGRNSIRNTSDYQKGYFLGKYGAIKDVDFSDYVYNIINKLGDEVGDEKL